MVKLTRSSLERDADGKKKEVVIQNYAIVARAIYTRIYVGIT